MQRRYFRLLITILVVALLVGAMWFLLASREPEQTLPDMPEKSTQNTQQTKGQSTEQSAAVFDKKQFSLDDPASPWLVVNKHRPLSPIDYTPPLATPSIPLRLAGSTPEMQISTQMKSSLEKLVITAKGEGVQLMLASGYRSYQTQVSVYNNEVKRNGQSAADRVSARPGHSEHQTGLAADIEPVSRQCEIEVCFGELPEGKWLAAHAYEYGFIIRYPSGSEPTTGYSYEPWHIRYVGEALARELHAQGNPPLENFFGLEAAASYN